MSGRPRFSLWVSHSVCPFDAHVCRCDARCVHAFARDDTEPLHSQHFVIPIVASERPLAVEGSGPIQGRSRPLLCSRRRSIRSHLARR